MLASHQRMLQGLGSSCRRVPGKLVTSRPLVLRRATAPDNNPGPADEKLNKVTEELKKAGMTAGKARMLLKTWSDAGAKDPESVRKLLMSKSLAPIPALSFQALLDAVASFGGFYLGGLASEGEDFPFRIGIELIGYAMGIFYFVQVLAGGSLIVGLLFTTYKYGANSAQLLTAVQSMAGPSSGVNLLDKATQAVNMFKVVTALESVAALLRDEYANPPTSDSLKNLGAYLTLAQARESLGFKPEDYGLSEKDAGNIAYAFFTFDTNQNFKLEANELGALCASLGKDLNQEEMKEALKILDLNGNGYIEFNEFVAWWVKSNGAPQAQAGKA